MAGLGLASPPRNAELFEHSNTHIPYHYYSLTMAPTTPRARARLAHKHLTLSTRGRIIGRRRGEDIYKVIVVAEKIPKTKIFNTIKLTNTRLS